MTRSQSLAFVGVCVGSPKVKAHLEAILGHGGVPSVEDFDATAEESFDRVEWFIDHLMNVAETLRAHHKLQPKQKPIKFDKPVEETEAKMVDGEIRTRRVR